MRILANGVWELFLHRPLLIVLTFFMCDFSSSLRTSRSRRRRFAIHIARHLSVDYGRRTFGLSVGILGIYPVEPYCDVCVCVLVRWDSKDGRLNLRNRGRPGVNLRNRGRPGQVVELVGGYLRPCEKDMSIFIGELFQAARGTFVCLASLCVSKLSWPS